MNSKNKMKLVAVVQYGEGDNKKSRWTNIGIAFENRDAMRSATLCGDFHAERR
jgi:hypothetical protein